MVADSAVLAATTNANVLIVLDSGKTRRAAAKRAKERFSQLGVEVKGLILNRVNPRDDTYDYSYSYSYYYTPTQLRHDNKRRFNGKGKVASDQGQPA